MRHFIQQASRGYAKNSFYLGPLLWFLAGVGAGFILFGTMLGY